MGPRADARAKVTGQARFTGDLWVPGMLYGGYLEAPVPHARLLRVDPRPALGLPGVVAILTGQDLLHWPDVDPYYGPSLRDRPVLAIDRIRFAGEPVAAVAAIDPTTVEAALERIHLEYEPLPPVLDVEQALRPGSPAVHEGGSESGAFHGLSDMKARAAAGHNVCYRHEVAWGDVQEGFAASDVVFEDTFSFPAVYHYAMEPHTCLARFRADLLEVWSSAQHPNLVRADLARMFRLPLHRVRVQVPYVGGGFGSKSYIKIEPLTAALARHARAPVRLALSVAQAMRTNHRHAARIYMRTGVRRDGTLVARECRVLLDTGAYADNGPRVAHAAAMRILGPYRFQHARSEALAVYTNTPPAGSFRAIGAVQTIWAGETQVNRIAEHLGIDPVQLRLRNLPQRGDTFRPGRRAIDAQLSDGLRRAATAVDWWATGGSAAPSGAARAAGGGQAAVRGGQAPVRRGVGIAMGIMDAGANRASVALVRLHPDATATLLTSTTEIGQGSRTVLRAIAALELGISAEQVRVVQSDTARTPYDRSTGASRSTTLMGLAVQQAAREAARQLLEGAARLLEVPVERLRLNGGAVEVSPENTPGTLAGVVESRERSPDATPRRLALADVLARLAAVPGQEILGRGYVVPDPADPSPRPVFWEAGMGAAVVEVDTDTGLVRVLRYVAVADVGKAIHPALAEGQDEGAAVQGLGHTLLEEMRFDGGTLLNAGLVDYRVPTFDDLPAEGLTSILVENGDGPGPHGSKGMGEGGIVSVAPAVTAAVYRACGVWLNELPITPERVWRRILKHSTGGVS